MTILFFEGVVVGFLAHQIKPIMAILPHGPREWLSYTLGVIATWPTAMRIHDQMDRDSSEGGRTRFTLSYFIAFLAVGIGVVLGWIFEIALTPIEEE